MVDAALYLIEKNPSASCYDEYKRPMLWVAALTVCIPTGNWSVFFKLAETAKIPTEHQNPIWREVSLLQFLCKEGVVIGFIFIRSPYQD